MKQPRGNSWLFSFFGFLLAVLFDALGIGVVLAHPLICHAARYVPHLAINRFNLTVVIDLHEPNQVFAGCARTTHRDVVVDV